MNSSFSPPPGYALARPVDRHSFFRLSGVAVFQISVAKPLCHRPFSEMLPPDPVVSLQSQSLSF